MTTVYARFRVRGRNAAEHMSLNEVLLDRELGLETDTRKFKFGDGETAWNDLDYAGVDLPGDLEAIGALDTQSFGRDLLTLASLAELKALLALTAADIVAALGYTPMNAASYTNVENKSSATIRGELTAGNVTGALGYTPTSITGLTGAQSASAIKTGLALTKADVGLGSAENKSSATIRGEITSGNVTTALGFTPANVAGHLGQFAPTTSAQLASVISDETGSGALVFATSPTLVTPTLGTASATRLLLGNGSVSAPALAFTGDMSTGFYYLGGGQMNFASSGVELLAFFGVGMAMASGKRFYFDGGAQTYITQNAANTLDIVGGPGAAVRFSSSLVTFNTPIWLSDQGSIAALAGGTKLYGTGGWLYTTGGSGTVTPVSPA